MGSANIVLVWNSCWPDGVLMGTFICFFITTKMSYILTPLLPLFPKGCQHKSHYNTTAGGNSFPPLTHYFFKRFCKERNDLDTKIAGKRTVQCDVSQRSFTKRLLVFVFIAYGERATHTEPGSVLARGVGAVPDMVRMGFATGTPQHSPHSWKQMSEIRVTLPDPATALCRGAASGWYTPSLCFFMFLAYMGAWML